MVFLQKNAYNNINHNKKNEMFMKMHENYLSGSLARTHKLQN